MTIPEVDRTSEVTAPMRKLNDEEMVHFIRDGYVIVQTGLPRSFHEDLCRKLQEVIDTEGNWGNNMLPRVPEIQAAFDDPVVRGALASILGSTFVVHPHRYCHRNEPGSAPQRLHKDSLEFEGDRHIRHHRPRWAIAFYYPQDVTEDMGPTGIVPGSQYYLTEPEDRARKERPVCVRAGTVVIVNFDIWHRALANTSGKQRYMIKFEFGRMDDPVLAPWPSGGDHLPAPVRHVDVDHQEVLWSRVWNWLQGREFTTSRAIGAVAGDVGQWVDMLRNVDTRARRHATGLLGQAGQLAQEDLPALVAALQDEDEPVRLNAAYALGEIGAPSVSSVIEVLRTGRERTRQYAAYALSAIGAQAVPALEDLARDDDEQLRVIAVDTLGDIGRPATTAVPTLTAALRDESEWVRRFAVEALGTMGAPAASAVPALTAMLRDQSHNVRLSAVTALARIGPAAVEAVPELVETLNGPDRYPRGWAAIALRRIGTPEATGALLDHLIAARWCPVTTIKNRY